MDIFLNGEFVSEEQAAVSVFDRGFMYGDGVFETIPVHQGTPFLLDRHLGRLAHGLGSLGIPERYDFGELLTAVSQLIQRNNLKFGVIRIQVSRGLGKRGYTTAGNNSPTVVISLHEAPPSHTPQAGIHLIIASQVLSDHDPFATLKTTNKLVNIAAMREAEKLNVHDALLMNAGGYVTETTSGNVFSEVNGTVVTPPLNCGCLAGITRGYLLELARELQIPVIQENLTPQQLAQSEGVFVTNSVRGIQNVESIDGNKLAQSKLGERLSALYAEHITNATSNP